VTYAGIPKLLANEERMQKYSAGDFEHLVGGFCQSSLSMQRAACGHCYRPLIRQNINKVTTLGVGLPNVHLLLRVTNLGGLQTVTKFHNNIPGALPLDHV
jgi:hypothetical protein